MCAMRDHVCICNEVRANLKTGVTSAYVCMSEGKKYSFFGKFGVLCFLITPVLRVALLPYYRPYLPYHQAVKGGTL